MTSYPLGKRIGIQGTPSLTKAIPRKNLQYSANRLAGSQGFIRNPSQLLVRATLAPSRSSHGQQDCRSFRGQELFCGRHSSKTLQRFA
jgi:hypothetical protein